MFYSNCIFYLCRAYIKELIEDGKKFICFAHHKSMMEGISTVLENMKTRLVN